MGMEHFYQDIRDLEHHSNRQQQVTKGMIEKFFDYMQENERKNREIEELQALHEEREILCNQKTD